MGNTLKPLNTTKEQRLQKWTDKRVYHFFYQQNREKMWRSLKDIISKPEHDLAPFDGEPLLLIYRDLCQKEPLTDIVREYLQGGKCTDSNAQIRIKQALVETLINLPSRLQFDTPKYFEVHYKRTIVRPGTHCYIPSKQVIDLNAMLRNVQIQQLEKKIMKEDSSKIPYRNKILEYLRELRELSNDDAKKGPCIVYLIGRTGSAKSSLINLLLGKRVAKVGQDKPSTSQIKGYKIPDQNALFYDTRGLEGKQNIKQVLEALLQKMKEHPPHVVLFCCAKEMLRDDGGRMEEIAKLILFLRNSLPVPKGKKYPFETIFVLTKIDVNCKYPWSDDAEYVFNEANKTIMPGEGKKPHEVVEEAERILGDDMKKVAVYTHCPKIFVRPRKFDGSKILLDLIAYASPLASQISEYEGEPEFLKRRRVIATKIIYTFSAINSFLTIIPLVDIALTFMATKKMVSLISTLTIHEDRTWETYIDRYCLLMTGSAILRGVILIGGTLMNLIIVGIVIGQSVQMLSTSGITAGLGWHAFRYFCGVNKAMREEEIK